MAEAAILHVHLSKFPFLSWAALLYPIELFKPANMAAFSISSCLAGKLCAKVLACALVKLRAHFSKHTFNNIFANHAFIRNLLFMFLFTQVAKVVVAGGCYFFISSWLFCRKNCFNLYALWLTISLYLSFSHFC